MKNKSSKIILIALAVVLVLSATVFGTVAAFKKSSNNAINTLNPGNISCEVVETFTDNAETSIKVRNIETDTNSVGGYIRVKLCDYWKDSSGNVVMGNSWLTEPINYDSTAWYYNSTDGYYYCRSVTAPAALTPELLATGQSITLTTDAMTDNHQALDIIAEIIQAKPDSVINDCWGVSVDTLNPTP